MADITLTAGVRQNLLSLQNTAGLMATTQNRLATGKKVNSALDNPTNFFTSQALGNRASDLNNLLDSIGQAQQTLKAADTGITSLTKLVQSAKSIATQARQATLGTSSYGSVSYTGAAATAETLGHIAGTANGPATSAGSLVLTVNGTDTTFAVGNGDSATTVAATINGTTGFGATGAVTASVVGGKLTLDANNADTDFSVKATTTAQLLTDFGLTAGGVAGNSTSLLDNIGSAGQSLSIAVNGGSAQTINFGTGAGQISTLAELNTALGGLTGVSASVTGGKLTFSVAGASSQTSLSVTSSNVATRTALGITDQNLSGTYIPASPDATRSSLQNDYNALLSQIDALAKDSSYNGVNLLNGDNLKVTFNEKGTSSQTITGVTYDSAGLGLSTIGGSGFQSNTNVDSTISNLDTALNTLRTQASKFGSNLTTVQTRQDFTKSLINTLQTGADNLVLADTNEEAANALALQTRQQLSTTALSLANQASQGVLRLF